MSTIREAFNSFQNGKHLSIEKFFLQKTNGTETDLNNILISTLANLDEDLLSNRELIVSLARSLLALNWYKFDDKLLENFTKTLTTIEKQLKSEFAELFVETSISIPGNVLVGKTVETIEMVSTRFLNNLQHIVNSFNEEETICDGDIFTELVHKRLPFLRSPTPVLNTHFSAVFVLLKLSPSSASSTINFYLEQLDRIVCSIVDGDNDEQIKFDTLLATLLRYLTGLETDEDRLYELYDHVFSAINTGQSNEFGFAHLAAFFLLTGLTDRVPSTLDSLWANFLASERPVSKLKTISCLLSFVIHSRYLYENPSSALDCCLQLSSWLTKVHHEERKRKKFSTKRTKNHEKTTIESVYGAAICGLLCVVVRFEQILSDDRLNQLVLDLYQVLTYEQGCFHVVDVAPVNLLTRLEVVARKLGVQIGHIVDLKLKRLSSQVVSSFRDVFGNAEKLSRSYEALKSYYDPALQETCLLVPNENLNDAGRSFEESEEDWLSMVHLPLSSGKRRRRNSSALYEFSALDF